MNSPGAIGTVQWLGFAVSVAVAVAGAAAAERGGQYAASGVLGVVGAWTLLASLLFDGTATGRVVHTLELREAGAHELDHAPHTTV